MKKENVTTRLLEATDVQEIVRRLGMNEVMDLAIDSMRVSFAQYTPATTQIPIRSGFNYQLPNPGLIEWMPLYANQSEVIIKVVGYHPESPRQYGLPTIISTISKYDTSNGHLEGLVDGVLLTALRTGAASALATENLAKPDSNVLGLIGCGAQAITQLHALSRIYDLQEVLCYDVEKTAQETFAERCKTLKLDLTYRAASIEEIVSESDILCTVTSLAVGAGPLFKDYPHKSHLHINAVGSDFPGKIELPVELLEKGFVVPDFQAQALLEGESQQLDAARLGPDLHKIIKSPSDYAAHQSELTIFDSTGWALEDQVIMNIFLDLADRFDLGKCVEIEYRPHDVKNPYEFLRTGPTGDLLSAALSFSQKD